MAKVRIRTRGLKDQTKATNLLVQPTFDLNYKLGFWQTWDDLFSRWIKNEYWWTGKSFIWILTSWNFETRGTWNHWIEARLVESRDRKISKFQSQLRKTNTCVNILMILSSSMKSKSTLIKLYAWWNYKKSLNFSNKADSRILNVKEFILLCQESVLAKLDYFLIFRYHIRTTYSHFEKGGQSFFC